MKITTENQEIILEEVFNGVTLRTSAGETMSIQMRDSGFELCYQGKLYFAKQGYLEPFKTSERGNILVNQHHTEDVACVNGAKKD